LVIAHYLSQSLLSLLPAEPDHSIALSGIFKSMIYNAEGYTPKGVSARRKAAKDGIPARKEMSQAERKANLERYAYPAGRGWTRRRAKRRGAPIASVISLCRRLFG
jgi:hypothetical protein